MRKSMTCLFVFAGLMLQSAGCADQFSLFAPPPASVTQNGTTVRVASPLPFNEFAPGEDVQFAIEVFRSDKSEAAGHPGPGGHYHVKINGRESVIFESDIPSFKVALPANIERGNYEFSVQYHAHDGVTDLFELSVPFRVR